MLNAVIFDMDGVIVDSEPLHHKAYQKMFLDFNLDVNSSFIFFRSDIITDYFFRKIKQ